MWKDYFVNSTILGIDINPECKNYKEESVFVEIGSQTNEYFLSKISEEYGPFDLIIDDGSHINYDVITKIDCFDTKIASLQLQLLDKIILFLLWMQ